MTHASILLVLTLAGQTVPSPDAGAIETAKNTKVNRIDSSLPDKAFASWLQDLTEVHTEIRWEVNDCGEQTGNPAVDRDRDIPMCVQAEIDLAEQRKLYVELAVGTFKKGIHPGPAAFYSAYVVGPDGSTHSIRKLSGIPRAVEGFKQHPRGNIPPPEKSFTGAAPVSHPPRPIFQDMIVTGREP